MSTDWYSSTGTLKTCTPHQPEHSSTTIIQVSFQYEEHLAETTDSRAFPVAANKLHSPDALLDSTELNDPGKALSTVTKDCSVRLDPDVCRAKGAKDATLVRCWEPGRIGPTIVRKREMKEGKKWRTYASSRTSMPR